MACTSNACAYVHSGGIHAFFLPHSASRAPTNEHEEGLRAQKCGFTGRCHPSWPMHSVPERTRVWTHCGRGLDLSGRYLCCYVLDSSTRPSPIECSNVVHRQPPFSSILDETSRPHDLNGSDSYHGAPTPPVDRVRHGGWRPPRPRWHRSPPAPRQQRRRARALTVREAGPALAHCCLLRLGPKRPAAESLGRDPSKRGVVWCAD